MPIARAVASVLAKLPVRLYVSFAAVDCSAVLVMMDSLLMAHKELSASPLNPNVPKVCVNPTSSQA